MQMRKIGIYLSITMGALSLTALALPVKPSFKNWGLYNGQSSSHIQALEAWKIETGSKSVVVAVIDTGIDPDHPDIKSNLWSDLSKRGPSTMNAPSVYGWDFVTKKANPRDLHGHGTHVAGIIGSVSDPFHGVSGVAQKVSLMPVRYYADQNTGAINLNNTVQAIHYAIDHGAKVINYSGGGPEFAEEEYLAIKRAESKGILFVAAAGNENQNTDLIENYYYPSAYRLSNIISVAAIDIQNKKLKSSNWGKNKVDVAAPGENIYSTLPGNKYGYMSGTSQATAFVTGIAALLLSKNPNLTPVQIKKLIRDSVDPLPGFENLVGSGGKVNAYRALLALKPSGLLANKDSSLFNLLSPFNSK